MARKSYFSVKDLPSVLITAFAFALAVFMLFFLGAMVLAGDDFSLDFGKSRIIFGLSFLIGIPFAIWLSNKKGRG